MMLLSCRLLRKWGYSFFVNQIFDDSSFKSPDHHFRLLHLQLQWLLSPPKQWCQSVLHVSHSSLSSYIPGLMKYHSFFRQILGMTVGFYWRVLFPFLFAAFFWPALSHLASLSENGWLYFISILSASHLTAPLQIGFEWSSALFAAIWCACSELESRFRPHLTALRLVLLASFRSSGWCTAARDGEWCSVSRPWIKTVHCTTVRMCKCDIYI